MALPRQVTDQLEEITEYLPCSNPDVDDSPLSEYALNYVIVLMHSLYLRRPDLPVPLIGVNLNGGVDVYWTGKVFLTIPSTADVQIKDFRTAEKVSLTSLDEVIEHVLRSMA